ncbi:hypothetical protein HYALB_00004490 [Hymenoscyphus albidus]|uniref:Uncharacterized protein n=1 Tax=Hymenoscyphus albidus TaxID=595503 RepID=A0A9N9M141_9HELO|nr:hypothetical protein HYALB_00004490 [Hymenoscyphus albidus]
MGMGVPKEGDCVKTTELFNQMEHIPEFFELKIKPQVVRFIGAFCINYRLYNDKEEEEERRKRMYNHVLNCFGAENSSGDEFVLDENEFEDLATWCLKNETAALEILEIERGFKFSGYEPDASRSNEETGKSSLTSTTEKKGNEEETDLAKPANVLEQMGPVKPVNLFDFQNSE